MKIFPESVEVLQKSMDMRMLQQRVTATNIANADTPGYTARKMDFETSMENALAGMAEPGDITYSEDPVTLDGNNVDLDEEMSNLSRAKFMYSLTAQVVAKRLGVISTILDKEQ